MIIFLWLFLVVAIIVWMTVRLKLHPFPGPAVRDAGDGFSGPP
jgi:hypothetical protein